MKKIFPIALSAITIAFISSYFMFNASEKKSNEQISEKKGPSAAEPGWLEQRHIMKANEDGIIPSGLYTQWREADRKNRFNKKGTSSDIASITELGPSNVGGRTRDLIVDINNTDRILAAAISGGLWESLNGGKTWKNHNDLSANLNITCIIQSKVDPKTIYYGTGEGIGNSSGAPGEGIFKSIDGGKTFEQLSSTLNDSFEYIWDIEHSMTDSNTFYVSTKNKGLFKSKDGGKTFTKVFSTTQHIYDIEVFPNGSVLLGSNAQGIYYSEDGEESTFTKITNGLPTSGFHRIEIEYADSFPNVVFAVYGKNVGSYDGTTIGLYKSSNGGKTWKYVGNPADSKQNFGFTWYTLALGVDPDDTTKIVAGSAGFTYSTNGGETWRIGNLSHADYHVFTFHPEKTGVFYAGNDGGIYEYNWSNIQTRYIDLNNGYNVTQFYAGSFNPTGNIAIAGAQDNGTQMSTDGGSTYKSVYGGDGSYCHINQQFPKIAYVSSQNGNIRKTGDVTFLSPLTSSVRNELDENNDSAIDDGAWFINPFEMNYKSSDQLFFPTRRRLFVSFDGAGSWKAVTNFKSNLYSVGIPNNSNPERVFVGGDNLVLWRVDDPFGTEPGNEVNLRKNIPTGLSSSFISNIKVHPQTDTSLYISLSNYSVRPRAWRVDGVLGEDPTWVDISGDLPENLPVNWIEVDPYRPNTAFYAATDFGLYVTENGGKNWVKEERIPNVSIHQIRIRESDRKMFIYTHGRGIWLAELKDMEDPFIGIDESQNTTLKVNLFPNPTSNILNLELNNNSTFAYKIVDLTGKEIQTGKSSIKQIDVASLANGTYLIHINTENKNYQSTFIKN